MAKRTKLSQRKLPDYLKGEEIMNMSTHIVGGGLGVIALALCAVKASLLGDTLKIVCGCIYGFTMVLLYTISSVYHGLRPGTGKKVLQVIDHCTIYFLISGTYTPIVACAIAPPPTPGWGGVCCSWSGAWPF